MRSIDFLRYKQKKKKKKNDAKQTHTQIHAHTCTHIHIANIYTYIWSSTYGHTVWIFATDLVALGATLLEGVLLLVLELHDCG